MTAIHYAVLVAWLFVILSVVGYPLRRLLDGPGDTICPVPAPIIGMVVIQVVTWYWFEAGGNGLARPVVAVFAIGIVATVARWRIDHSRGRKPDRRGVVLALLVAVGFSLLIVLNFTAVLRLPYLATADSGNNDAVSYAIKSDHLVHSGFHQAGQVVGFDLGKEVRNDAFGSTTIIGSLSVLSHLDSWKVNDVVLFAFGGLAVYCMAALVRVLFGGRVLAAAGIGLAGGASVLFVYVMSAFFVGQVMAMAAAPLFALVGLRAADWSGDRREAIRVASMSAVVFLMLLSHYSHMALLLPPVVLVPVVFGSAENRLSLRLLLRRALRAVSIVGLGGVAAAVIAPAMVVLAYSVTLNRQSVAAGWALPGFVPVEIAGFMRWVTPRVSSARVIWSIGLMLLVCVLGGLLHSKDLRSSRFCLATLGVVLASYAILFRKEGVGYRQWKWITFFAPMFIAVLLVIIIMSTWLVASSARHRRASAFVAGAVLVAYISVLSLNSQHKNGAALRERQQLAYTKLDAWDLQRSPSLAGISELNVDLDPFWDSMWAVYFLPDKKLRVLRPTYFTPSAALPGWTLVPGEGQMSGPAVRPVNASMRLLNMPGGASSDRPGRLSSHVAVQLNDAEHSSDSVEGVATVTNDGDTTWLPPSVAVGGVNLGVHLIGSDGSTINLDWARQILVPGFDRPIPPGVTVQVPFRVPRPSEAGAHLSFQLVAEGVAWFGDEVAG